jgi:hypothetical protein
MLAPAAMPAPSRNFAGLSRNASCSGTRCGAGIPPDTNGDVGLNYYIQSVNSSFAIYNKSGTRLAAFTEDALWAGSGKAQCDGNSYGDPVVLYDPMADRWILTDMAFSVSGGRPVAPYYICIAVSKSSNPVSGGWYLYAVRTDTGRSGQPPVGTMDDYPRFGIWTDCLYFSANGFNSAGSYVGGMFGSFSRIDMYAGRALTGSLGFLSGNNDYFTMIPSNLSAPGTAGLPPAGTPNYYVQEALNGFSYKVRKFIAGANCSGGTLSAPTAVSQSGYTLPNGAIVPQPNTGNKLDSLGDRMMQKVQYRRLGKAESLWVSHTFRTSRTGPTGVQWAQINVSSGTVRTMPVQQQLYHPADSNYRWMSSIAADKQGNAAIGYSISGSGTYPGIAYAGRLASDPLNTLAKGEMRLVSGAGSQTNSCGGAPCHRWGDYSSISVDPSDGCTFWYTSEYYTSQSAGSGGTWNTRIGSFSFPACTGSTAVITVTKTFYSIASEDGWVLESKAGSGIGGTPNSVAATFRLGDDVSNRQYRSILSFNTSSLPDNAIVTAVQLKIHRAGLMGASPFNTLGNIIVDVRNGSFSSNALLQAADFQAPATQLAAMTLTNTPVNGWDTKFLPLAYFSNINLTGTTDFRLRFAKPSNNNGAANYISYYSSNDTTPALRPTLVITYRMP